VTAKVSREVGKIGATSEIDRDLREWREGLADAD
jgi:hypothetical protein